MRKLAPAFLMTSIVALASGSALALGDHKNKAAPKVDATAPAATPSNNVPATTTTAPNPSENSPAKPGTNPTVSGSSPAGTSYDTTASANAGSTSIAASGSAATMATPPAGESKKDDFKQDNPAPMKTASASDTSATSATTTETTPKATPKKKVAKKKTIAKNDATQPRNDAAMPKSEATTAK